MGKLIGELRRGDYVSQHFLIEGEIRMDNFKRTVAIFAVGLGIGAAVALLLAPQSGEDTRDWISDQAKRKAKLLRRKGQQSLESLQDAMDASGDKIASVLKSSKGMLDSVAEKFD